MDRPTSAGQVVASKTPSTQTASAMYKVYLHPHLCSHYWPHAPWCLKVLEVDRRDGLSEISSTNKKRCSPFICLILKKLFSGNFMFFLFYIVYIVVVVVVVKRTRTQIIMMMTEQTSSTGSPVDLRPGGIAGCDGLRLCRFQVRIHILPGTRCQVPIFCRW